MGGFGEQSFGGQQFQGSAESHYIDTPEQVDLRYSVAGVGSRFVAHLLDTLLLAAAAAFEVVLLIIFWTTIDRYMNGRSDKVAMWIVAGFMLLHFAIFEGYFVFCEAYWKGKTPGKHWMKLRVIKDSGRQVTFFEAFVRNLLRLVDSLPGFYLIGIITMLCNKSHKRLGDFAAGTLVIHERHDEQPLLVQTSMIEHPSTVHQPLDPWRTSAPQMFPADAIARLTPADLTVIEAFFSRALDLTLEMRAAMAARLAQQMAAKMNVPFPEGNPERMLESIAYAMRGSGRSW